MFIRKSKHDEIVAAMLASAKAGYDSIASGYQRQREELLARHEALGAKARTTGRLASEALAERDAARATLREIAAMETPSANATVKRMASAARDGLPAMEDAS